MAEQQSASYNGGGIQGQEPGGYGGGGAAVVDTTAAVAVLVDYGLMLEDLAVVVDPVTMHLDTGQALQQVLQQINLREEELEQQTILVVE